MYRCSANRRRISGTSPRYQATISSSDMPSKSGRAARRSVIFAWSASRSVSGGLAKTQPSVAWMSVGALRVLVALHPDVRGHARHLPPERVVHLLRGEPRGAHAQHARHGRVQVAVPAEAPDHLGVGRRELVELEGTEALEGVAPAGLRGLDDPEGPGGRGDRPREHLAHVPAGVEREALARLPIADPTFRQPHRFPPVVKALGRYPLPPWVRRRRSRTRSSSVLGDQALLEHEGADALAGRGGLLHQLGHALVAEERVERRRRLGRGLGVGAAAARRRPRCRRRTGRRTGATPMPSSRIDSSRLRAMTGQVDVELEVALAAGERDGGVVADHLRARPG